MEQVQKKLYCTQDEIDTDRYKNRDSKKQKIKAIRNQNTKEKQKQKEIRSNVKSIEIQKIMTPSIKKEGGRHGGTLDFHMPHDLQVPGSIFDKD